MLNICFVSIDDNDVNNYYLKYLIQNILQPSSFVCFTDPIQGMNYVLESDINIIFIEIELGLYNGIEIANKLKNTSTRIVFLTSSTEYAVQAFQLNALHYMLKPITSDMILEVLRRYKTSAPNINNGPLKLNNLVKRICINNIGKTIVLNLNDLMYFTSSGSYTEICTIDSKYTASKILKHFDDLLVNHPDFLRIHRSNIINKNFVRAINRSSYKTIIEMVDGKELEVSPSKKEEIYELLTM